MSTTRPSSHTRKKSAWRAFFEKQGLLFGDSTLEWEYLYKANYSHTARMVGGVFCAFASVFYGYTLYLDVVELENMPSVDAHCVLGSLGVLSATTFAAAFLLFATACMPHKRSIAVATQARCALLLLLLVLLVDIPFAAAAAHAVCWLCVARWRCSFFGIR